MRCGKCGRGGFDPINLLHGVCDECDPPPIARSARGVCLAPGCGKPIRGRPDQRTCDPACRQRLSRAARRASTWSEQRAIAWGLSPRDFWRTPDPIFELASAEWGPFELDAAAAGPEDARCPLWITPGEDALRVRWTARCSAAGVPPRIWVNPPYGSGGGHNGGGLLSWVQHARIEAESGAIVCMLVPNNQATEWGRMAARHALIRVLPRRVAFIDPDSGRAVHGNRHESMFVVFGAQRDPPPPPPRPALFQ